MPEVFESGVSCCPAMLEVWTVAPGVGNLVLSHLRN